MPGAELKKGSFIMKFISADPSSFESQIHNGKREPCRQFCYLSTAFKGMAFQGKRHISVSMWVLV